MFALVIECKKKNFTDRKTGEVREYYIVGCSLDGAGIGFVYSDFPVPVGEEVELQVSTDRDHKFSVILAAQSA